MVKREAFRDFRGFRKMTEKYSGVPRKLNSKGLQISTEADIASERFMRKIEDWILSASEADLRHIEKFIKLAREKLRSRG